MLGAFKKYASERNPAYAGQRILLAVSGGKDSVCMSHLFHASGYDFGIVHCNFSLRGSESDKDEEFARELANKFGVPFYSKKFDTNSYKEQTGDSTQMAARNLRFDYFSELLEQTEFEKLATAHHQGDVLETVLLNLTRGGGIAGLHGIRERENIVRPMLFTNPDEIEAYMKDNGFEWREDSSNESDSYKRNKLRHHVVPILKEINPNVFETVSEVCERIALFEDFGNSRIKKEAEKIVSRESDVLNIEIEKLQSTDSTLLILDYLLTDFGFSYSDLKNIVGALSSSSGTKFLAGDHQLVVDRENLIVSSVSGNIPVDLSIPGSGEYKTGNIKINVEEVEGYEKTGGNTAYFSGDKLGWPLNLRGWQNGDKIRPLGMGGMKKVSDILIDEKVPLHLKNEVNVLFSNGEACWVVGFRISEDFKVDDSSQKIVKITVSDVED